MSENTAPVNSQSTDGQLSTDKIHQLLSAHLRRYGLYCLYRYENPIRLPDVAQQVTEWEHETPSLPEDRLRIYNTLYHCHIPKLDDAGVVSYSQEEDMVDLAENAEELRPFLEQTIEKDLRSVDTQRL